MRLCVTTPLMVTAVEVLRMNIARTMYDSMEAEVQTAIREINKASSQVLEEAQRGMKRALFTVPLEDFNKKIKHLHAESDFLRSHTFTPISTENVETGSGGASSGSDAF